MEEIYKEKSIQMEGLMCEIDSANRAISEKDVDIGRLQGDLNGLSEKYHKLKRDISPAKFRSVKRKESYLKHKEKLLKKRQQDNKCAALEQNKLCQDEDKLNAMKKSIAHLLHSRVQVIYW